MTKVHCDAAQKITLTKRAANKIIELQENLKLPSVGIRFADKIGFCGKGYDYVIDFALTSVEGDQIFYSQGIQLFVPRSSLSRLQGSILDCSDHQGEQTFMPTRDLPIREYFDIHNPNAKGACPCACGNGFKC
ncbi:MAG: iron-sulfur cluster assembly accessory protein [Parachlamydiales bacterium]|nr:iron-sulfur cluster assembly accessory protein [Candidatus Acheromyda pituitae]